MVATFSSLGFLVVLPMYMYVVSDTSTLKQSNYLITFRHLLVPWGSNKSILTLILTLCSSIFLFSQNKGIKSNEPSKFNDQQKIKKNLNRSKSKYIVQTDYKSSQLNDNVVYVEVNLPYTESKAEKCWIEQLIRDIQMIHVFLCFVVGFFAFLWKYKKKIIPLIPMKIRRLLRFINLFIIKELQKVNLLL